MEKPEPYLRVELRAEDSNIDAIIAHFCAAINQLFELNRITNPHGEEKHGYTETGNYELKIIDLTKKEGE